MGGDHHRNSASLFIFSAMAPMKAMKGTAKGMTATAAYGAVAETTGLKTKDVRGVVEGIVAVAADELKKHGSFKLAGVLNMKLKKKPASKTVRALPMKKFKEMIN